MQAEWIKLDLFPYRVKQMPTGHYESCNKFGLFIQIGRSSAGWFVFTGSGDGSGLTTSTSLPVTSSLATSPPINQTTDVDYTTKTSETTSVTATILPQITNSTQQSISTHSALQPQVTPQTLSKQQAGIITSLSALDLLITITAAALLYRKSVHQ